MPIQSMKTISAEQRERQTRSTFWTCLLVVSLQLYMHIQYNYRSKHSPLVGRPINTYICVRTGDCTVGINKASALAPCLLSYLVDAVCACMLEIYLHMCHPYLESSIVGIFQEAISQVCASANMSSGCGLPNNLHENSAYRTTFTIIEFTTSHQRLTNT